VAERRYGRRNLGSVLGEFVSTSILEGGSCILNNLGAYGWTGLDLGSPGCLAR